MWDSLWKKLYPLLFIYGQLGEGWVWLEERLCEKREGRGSMKWIMDCRPVKRVEDWGFHGIGLITSGGPSREPPLRRIQEVHDSERAKRIEAIKLDWIVINHSLILWVSRLDKLTEIYLSKSTIVLTFKHQKSLALRQDILKQQREFQALRLHEKRQARISARHWLNK